MFDWLRSRGRHGGQAGSGAAHGVNGQARSRDAVLPGENGPRVTESMISLRGITKAYKTDAGLFWALKGIDLQVYPGEFVAVVGKSGSGKSTLVNVFTGIDHPTDGEAVIARTHIRQLDEGRMAEWRGRNMGIIFQFFQLLPTLTLVENVTLPMDLCQVYEPGERLDRAMHLLDRVGIASEADKFPAAVSGGHQQRVAIARALANDPPILVADEPTGNLDSRTADSIFRLFEALVERGKTILMVTHDDDLASRVPRTLVLADGLFVDEKIRMPATPFLMKSPHAVLPGAGAQAESSWKLTGQPVEAGANW